MADALQELKSIYEDVSEWLKYGELKNGALAVFYTFIGTIILGTNEIKLFLPLGCRIIFCLGLFGATFLSFVSFFPFIYQKDQSLSRKVEKYATSIVRQRNNIVFYSAIYINNAYENEWKQMIKSDEEINTLEQSLLNSYILQIKQVAELATTKMYFANRAIEWLLKCFRCGVILFVLASIVLTSCSCDCVILELLGKNLRALI